MIIWSRNLSLPSLMDSIVIRLKAMLVPIGKLKQLMVNIQSLMRNKRKKLNLKSVEFQNDAPKRWLPLKNTDQCTPNWTSPGSSKSQTASKGLTLLVSAFTITEVKQSKASQTSLELSDPLGLTRNSYSFVKEMTDLNRWINYWLLMTLGDSRSEHPEDSQSRIPFRNLKSIAYGPTPLFTTPPNNGLISPIMHTLRSKSNFSVSNKNTSAPLTLGTWRTSRRQPMQ